MRPTYGPQDVVLLWLRTGLMSHMKWNRNEAGGNISFRIKAFISLLVNCVDANNISENVSENILTNFSLAFCLKANIGMVKTFYL